MEVRVINNQIGHGVFATRAYSEGENVFTETKFLGMQHTDNETLDGQECCEYCMRFITTRYDMRQFPFVPAEMIETFVNTVHRVACECGHAVYCSEACHQRATAEYHSMMYHGPGAADMHAYVEHALATNEIFILCAKVLAKMYQMRRSDDESLELAFLANVRRPLWWDQVQIPDDDPGNDGGATFRLSLQHMTHDAVMHLRRAWAGVCASCPALDACVNVEAFARLIGMFETNNWGMCAINPVTFYSRYVRESLTREQQKEVRMRLGNENIWAYLMKTDDVNYREEIDNGNVDYDDDLGDDGNYGGINAACENDLAEGSGFYMFGCKMNHSCMPNCALLKCPDDPTDTTAVLANRDIDVGEELTIAYVNEHVVYSERQASLRDYMFTCMCPLCQEEMAEANI